MNRLFDITTSDDKRILIPGNRLIGVIETGEIKLFFEDDVKVILKVDKSKRKEFMDRLRNQLSTDGDSKIVIALSEDETAGIRSVEY